MDAIMRLSLSANPDVFYRLKEDPSICDVLMEFMRGKLEDELEKRTKEARAEGKAEGRAETEQELSANQAACVRVLMDRLGISREDAMDEMKIPARSRAGIIALL